MRTFNGTEPMIDCRPSSPRSSDMMDPCKVAEGAFCQGNLSFLRRQDILLFPWGILIHLRWSKLIHFQTRTFDVPLPRLSGNVLCLVNALINYLQLNSGAILSGPVFVYPVNS